MTTREKKTCRDCVHCEPKGFVCESCGKKYGEIGDGTWDEDAVFVCAKCQESDGRTYEEFPE